MLAVVGFISTIKIKKYVFINLLAIWIFTNLLLYYFFEFTILSFYQRIFYLGLVIMSILSALGLIYLFNLINKFVILKKKSNKLVFLLFGLLLILVFWYPAINYYNYDQDVAKVE